MACRVAVFTEKWYILSFMKANISVIKQGTVTSAQGFKAGAADAGIKYAGRLDLGLLYSDAPCVSTAVFTSNRVKAAPVLVSIEHMKDGKASAVIVNSGCANACTGKAGMKAAREMAKLAATKLKIRPEQVIVASTGVIEYRVEAASGPGAIINGLAAKPDFVKHGKRSDRAASFEAVVHSYVKEDGGSMLLRLYAGREDSVRIDDAVKTLLGGGEKALLDVRLVKTGQYRIEDGTLSKIE